VTFTRHGDRGSALSEQFGPLQKDIETLAKASEAVEKLRGVHFAWKDSGQTSVGLIAEEVAKVYPELVEFENGEAKGVNYSALVAVLVEAHKGAADRVQQAAVEIKAQQAEIKALRGSRPSSTRSARAWQPWNGC